MSSKRFSKWIEFNKYKVTLQIVRKYYIKKEGGERVNLLGKRFAVLFLKRLFFVFLSLFRFKRSPLLPYRQISGFKNMLKRILGISSFDIKGILPPNPDYKPIHFKKESSPTVSIIIAVHNHFNFTYNCLESILRHTSNPTFEIILVNDCSSDVTADYIKLIHNITYIENEQNLGFLKSCNKAAKIAKGKYLCFLNNDTQVNRDWLQMLVSVFQNDPETGLVGAKLIYPYGLLQEAGGLVNHLGDPANYGRYDDPKLSKYNYIRETDYCSGACIVIKHEDFMALNGFDERFTPAYYEDTDLCFSVRYILKKKVIYQPLSEIIHFEGVSSGKTITGGGVKSYQGINGEKFRNKWQAVIDNFPHLLVHHDIADKFICNPKILFIDATLPLYNNNSGSRRIFELIKIFRTLKYHVMFCSHDGFLPEPYFSELANMGIQVIYPKFLFQNAIPELKTVLKNINIAWISRPDLNRFYSPYIRHYSSAIWVYDTVDLHFVREERFLNLQRNPDQNELKKIEQIKETEISLARKADLTIAITETESDILNRNGAKKVRVIPNVHIANNNILPSFEERQGVCFIGGYDHQPNVDAALWLANEIMPVVWNTNPEIKLTLMGSNPPQSILDLQSEQVNVTGFVDDVSDYFNFSRIFVAPLRYGAGMKGKIGQSLEYALPVITTDIGAEGMNLRHGYHVIIANNSHSFAKEITELYFNRDLWNYLSSNSGEAIKPYSPIHISEQISKMFDTSKARNK